MQKTTKSPDNPASRKINDSKPASWEEQRQQASL